MTVTIRQARAIALALALLLCVGVGIVMLTGARWAWWALLVVALLACAEPALRVVAWVEDSDPFDGWPDDAPEDELCADEQCWYAAPEMELDRCPRGDVTERFDGVDVDMARPRQSPIALAAARVEAAGATNMRAHYDAARDEWVLRYTPAAG